MPSMPLAAKVPTSIPNVTATYHFRPTWVPPCCGFRSAAGLYLIAWGCTYFSRPIHFLQVPRRIDAGLNIIRVR